MLSACLYSQLIVQLELALNTSTVRSVSAPIGLDTVTDEDDGITSIHHADAAGSPAQPKRATSALAHVARSPNRPALFANGIETGLPAQPQGDIRKRPASVQVYPTTFETTDSTFGEGSGRPGALAKLIGQSGPSTPDRPHHSDDKIAVTTPSSADGSLSRRNSLMKPGVSYRIRPKRQSMTSTIGYQSTGPASAKSEQFPETGSIPTLVKHHKVPTTSTEGEDVQTPSASVLDHLSVGKDSAYVHMDAEAQTDEGLLGVKDDDENDLAKRMSAISTTTVTFGQ